MPRENLDLLGALAELEAERGIRRETLLEAVEAALVSAYRRNYGTGENVGVRIDPETGHIDVFVTREVVEEVTQPDLQISLEEARRIDPSYQVGDIIEFPVTPRDFGRIAAQTAKQVVVQRIREAERGMIYDEFIQREGDVVTGLVQRVQGRNVFIDLGKTEAFLPPSEQIPSERLSVGERVKVYIVEVKRTTKGPQVLISRTHPGLLKRLFELEVPEIHDGLVEIKAIAREAGTRSKVAVDSRDENVDPVGACVGHKGMRVQVIVNELKGEKIDIVRWSPDPAEYVANALSPAKASRVLISEDEKVARVIVPDYQLSLAIGRAGQNARLAAKLTGWRIDIRSESQIADEQAQAPAAPAGTLSPWAGALVASKAPIVAPWAVAEPAPAETREAERTPHEAPAAAGELAPVAAEARPAAQEEPAVSVAGEGAPARPRETPIPARLRRVARRPATSPRSRKEKEEERPRKPARTGAGRGLLDALAEAGLLAAAAPANEAGAPGEEGREASPAGERPRHQPSAGAADGDRPRRRRVKKPVLEPEPALDEETLQFIDLEEVLEDEDEELRPRRRPRKSRASGPGDELASEEE